MSRLNRAIRKIAAGDFWRIRMQATIASPVVPIGKIKSFGPFGPKYEIGHPLRQLNDGDWMIEVTLVESGEKTEYRLSRLSNDPEAR
jgi:hypothetical protein